MSVFSKKNNLRRHSRVAFKEGRSYDTDHLNPSRLCRWSTGLENSHLYRSTLSVKIRNYLEKKIGIGKHLALASMLRDVYTTTIEIVRLHVASQPSPRLVLMAMQLVLYTRSERLECEKGGGNDRKDSRI